MSREFAEINSSDTFEQRRHKRGFRLLAASFLALGSAPKLEIAPCPSHRVLVVDEKRFGKAPEALQKPLLRGRRGKGTRKQRKAAKARQRVIPTYTMHPPEYFSWSTEDGIERKYYVSVTGKLAPKDSSSNH